MLFASHSFRVKDGDFDTPYTRNWKYRREDIDKFAIFLNKSFYNRQ